MADVAYRSYTRSLGSNSVSSSRHGHDSRSSNGHKHDSPSKSRDDRSYRKSDRKSHHTKTKSTTSSTQPTYTQVPSASTPRSYSLEMMGPPPSSLEAIETTFEPSVLVTVPKGASQGGAANLVAVASLLTVSQAGTLVALPQGYLAGPKLFDNIHSLPSSYAAKLPRAMRDRALGYVSFPGLTVQAPGTFVLRVSLLRLASVGEARQDAVPVGHCDSTFLRVRM